MRESIEKMQEKIEAMCQLFIQDEWQTANEELSVVLEEMQGFLKEMEEQPHGAEYVQQIMNILEVVAQAMANKDGMQIADLMGYDVQNVLQEFQDQLEQLKQEEAQDE